MDMPSNNALQLAAQSWCQPETSGKEIDSENMVIGIARIIDPLLEHLYDAWAIIANASDGNWDKESEEWATAAKRWRDTWYLILDARLPNKENTDV